MMLCLQKHPKLDKMTVEIMVDFWLNHPNDLIKEMEKDIHPPVIDRKEVNQLRDNVKDLMKIVKNTKKIRSL